MLVRGGNGIVSRLWAVHERSLSQSTFFFFFYYHMPCFLLFLSFLWHLLLSFAFICTTKALVCPLSEAGQLFSVQQQMKWQQRAERKFSVCPFACHATRFHTVNISNMLFQNILFYYSLMLSKVDVLSVLAKTLNCFRLDKIRVKAFSFKTRRGEIESTVGICC